MRGISRTMPRRRPRGYGCMVVTPRDANRGYAEGAGSGHNTARDLQIDPNRLDRPWSLSSGKLWYQCCWNSHYGA